MHGAALDQVEEVDGIISWAEVLKLGELIRVLCVVCLGLLELTLSEVELANRIHKRIVLLVKVLQLWIVVQDAFGLDVVEFRPGQLADVLPLDGIANNMVQVLNVVAWHILLHNFGILLPQFHDDEQVTLFNKLATDAIVLLFELFTPAKQLIHLLHLLFCPIILTLSVGIRYAITNWGSQVWSVEFVSVDGIEW